MSTTIRIVRWTALVVCLGILGGLIGLLTRFSVYQDHHVARTPLVAAAFVAFGLAAWLLRKVALKPAIWLILIAGIAFQAIGFSAPPSHSSDSYRYMWDGQVQAAGIDPYLYPPSAAALVSLRNGYLWAPYATNVPKTAPYPFCAMNAVSKDGPAFNTVAGCSRINRLNDPTLYPPVAEAWFTLVYLIAGDGGSTPMQVAMALCAIATTVVLLWGLRKLGRDPRLAALWAWCPTAILEVGSDGHSDVLGTLITAVALIVLASSRTRGKTLLGGTLLGLAMATKLTPAFVIPGAAKRGWHYILLSVAAATVIVYIPHVLAAGRRIVGFFPGYLQQQGYSNGSGYALIAPFAHGKLASAVAVLLLGIVALAVLRYSNPDEPWRGGVVMTAAALVIGTPQFEWYSVLLVMLVALDGRAEWLLLSAGSYLADSSFITPTTFITHPRVWGYGGALVIILAITLVRYLRARRDSGEQIGGPRLSPAPVPSTRF